MMHLELNKIYHGDVLDVIKTFPDNSVNLIVTSPPYNKKRNHKNIHESDSWSNGGSHIDYISHTDDLDEGEYQKWQIDILDECIRVLKRDGSIFYNHKNRTINGGIISPLEWILKSNGKLKQEIIWKANNLVEIDRVKFFPYTERIYWIVKDKPLFNPESANYGDVWDIVPVRGEQRLGHPAPFPLEIPIRCILSVTNKNDIVLDPFMGSGTTAVACMKTERNYVGIEKEKSFIDISKERIKNFKSINNRLGKFL